uniref:RNase H type-1 domain-containing protein n=1 Tax=Lactuca sativa TaxID=4236 RepID=A0A9R1WCJ9_LACSA|nr:hypothetical protein LSAT_V11C200064880 [Lactuca sativa]
MAEEVVTVLTNLRLAANKINGSFEANDKRMEKYVKIVQWLTKSFKEFTIKQILRSENRRADALSKLASTCFDHLCKKRSLAGASSSPGHSVPKGAEPAGLSPSGTLGASARYDSVMPP